MRCPSAKLRLTKAPQSPLCITWQHRDQPVLRQYSGNCITGHIVLTSTEGPSTCISIKMTSLWVQWHLKSLASWLFLQLFIQAQIKENINAPRHWPFCGTPVNFPHKRPVTWKIFTFDDHLMSSFASIWWRHHVIWLNTLKSKPLTFCYCIFLTEIFYSLSQFSFNFVVLRVQFPICQYPSSWLGAQEVTSHHLVQCWPRSTMPY